MPIRIGLRSVFGLLTGVFLASLTFGSVRAVTAEQGVNVVRNGDFETGTQNSLFCTNGSGIFTIAAGYQGQSAKIAIRRAGSSVDFSHYDLPIAPSTSYRLSFAGRSTTGHDVRVLLQKRDTPSVNYGLSQRLNLTISWQVFTIDFTSRNLSSSVTDGHLRFALGRFDAAGDEYWFDDIVLENLSAPPPSPPQPDAVRLQFLPSGDDFANPERGFMKQSSIFVDQPLDPNKIRALQPSHSVVWVYFRLDNYRDPRDGYGVTLTNYQGQPIDEAGLTTIRSTFRTARAKGLKLVIRFVYNPGPGSTPDPNLANPDAPLELVLQHIAQLKPLLVANVDVIAAMQAGFVGHWGEWHSSKYLHQDRKAIVDALLVALPRRRMLQIRYPRYKEIFYQGPLTTTTAFSGADASRVGHHNDCFLRDLDDAGTYRSKSSQQPQHESFYCAGATDEISCWKRFLAQESRFTPVGGETCQLNPPRTDCPNALAEMEALHWSYINNDYKKEVLDGWRAGGCIEEIRRRLGYRFVLKEALVPGTVQRGGTLSLDVLLRNEGFASLYNPRPVFAVLVNSRGRYNFRLISVDPRRWEARQERSITAQVKLPATIATGTYTLGLWLPDAASTLRGSPSYAVRFANTNVWNASLGLNVLTSGLRVE